MDGTRDGRRVKGKGKDRPDTRDQMFIRRKKKGTKSVKKEYKGPGDPLYTFLSPARQPTKRLMGQQMDIEDGSSDFFQ